MKDKIVGGRLEVYCIANAMGVN